MTEKGQGLAFSRHFISNLIAKFDEAVQSSNVSQVDSDRVGQVCTFSFWPKQGLF